MKSFIFTVLLNMLILVTNTKIQPEYPDGYYPFEQSPNKQPPKVKKPPYIISNNLCPGILETDEEASKSLNNLCGNLNDGYIPVSPMGHKFKGEDYPFDLIRNHTLRFFSKTLPILKEDKTLPKVAKYKHKTIPYSLARIHRRRKPSMQWPQRRMRRSLHQNNVHLNELHPKAKKMLLEDQISLAKAQQEGRSVKSFCHNNYGVLCVIYNAFTGRDSTKKITQNRRQRITASNRNEVSNPLRPLTPCPSAVEYATPVFARNYQGVWRYVVQIPYEGYFTQTIEVTQCLSNKCHYMSGSCLSSPRWVSLLVAEIYYPDAIFPKLKKNSIRETTSKVPPGQTRRAAFHGPSRQSTPVNVPNHCDGRDEIGCYQVRLYYDWFLISGACKCWKADLYTRYRKEG